MISVLAISLALQPATGSAEIRNRADAAVGAYLGCLYGRVRYARSQQMSVATFRSIYDASCRTEQSSARRALASAIVLKGLNDPEGTADRLLADSRQNIRGGYLDPIGTPKPGRRIDPDRPSKL